MTNILNVDPSKKNIYIYSATHTKLKLKTQDLNTRQVFKQLNDAQLITL